MMEDLNISLVSSSEKNIKKVNIEGLGICSNSYCYEDTWLTVCDMELFDVLAPHKVSVLLSHFEKIKFNLENINGLRYDFEISNTHRNVEIGVKIESATGLIRYDPEEWSNPWSIKQYLNCYLDVIEPIKNVVLGVEIVDIDEINEKPIYDVYNGIGPTLLIKDSSITLESLYEEVFTLTGQIDSEVVSRLKMSLDIPVVERCIEFPPEYHQAGLGILNFFGTYLREQYPEENARVKIEQQGLNVRMIIQTESGELETVERALHEFELIVLGTEDANKFIDNDKLLLELRNELRIAKVRIDSQLDFIGLQENRIDKLLDLVGKGLSQSHQVAIDFKPQISLNNSVTINQDISSAISNISEIKEELTKNGLPIKAFDDLEHALIEIESESDPVNVRRSPAMSKFRRVLDKVVEEGSELNLALSKVDSGLEIVKELAGKYNKVAEWCGLPVVPSIFTK